MRPLKKKTGLLVLAALVVGLACIYGVGVWYFQTHYYPGLTVAGVDASFKTEDELAREIDKTAQEFEVTLYTDVGDDDRADAEVKTGSDDAESNANDHAFSLTVAASQIDVRENGAERAQAVRASMDETRWPLELIVGLGDMSTGLSFDATKLGRVVHKAVDDYNDSATYPTNAQIVLNDQANGFITIPEGRGTALDSSAVYHAAYDAFRNLVPEVDLADHALAQPHIRAADQSTQEALTRANNALYHEVLLEYDGNPVRTLGYEQWVEYLGVDYDLHLTLDEEAFASWADVWLWQSVDHAEDKSAYVLDSQALARDLVSVLEARSNEAVEIPVREVDRYLATKDALPKASWDSEQGRYVEVDITNQFARLYGSDGVVVWESVVTTGNEASGNGTPRGTYYVYDKKTDFTLLGRDQNGDGEYDYEHHVDYWMPFNEGIGLHDASWRKTYGGDRYLTAGSGGCVNLPHDAAKALYGLVHVGDKVIVHE